RIAVGKASYRERLITAPVNLVGTGPQRPGPRIGGCNEESRNEGTTFPRLGRRSDCGRIRRDAGVDRHRVPDGHSFDWNERQHHVRKRGEGARLIDWPVGAHTLLVARTLLSA